MKKKYLLIVILCIIISVGLYAYLEFNRKVKPMEDSQAETTLTADSLIKAFIINEKIANQDFLNKIIQVSGTITSIEKTDSSSVVVFALPQGNVRCYMTNTLNDRSTDTQKTILIKGLCTGFNADDLGIGADVIITRAIIAK